MKGAASSFVEYIVFHDPSSTTHRDASRGKVLTLLLAPLSFAVSPGFDSVGSENNTHFSSVGGYGMEVRAPKLFNRPEARSTGGRLLIIVLSGRAANQPRGCRRCKPSKKHPTGR